MSNLSVAFLWHFHQPLYLAPDRDVLTLPWVRLHTLKDYLDMLRHVRDRPPVHVTFNFTPSLLMQVQGYQEGRLTDRQYLLFRKRADELTAEERVEILRDFFLANWERMIEPYPRYFTLLLKRGKNIVEEELGTVALEFTDDEMRDLQMWANLAWVDPLFRPGIKELYERGKNFRESDKDVLAALQQRIINQVITEYRQAREDGQVELITSPLYHPILPLLIDSDLARESNPNLEIPFQFRHPEDAAAQIDLGLKRFEAIFGFRPKGLWPPEGSVCPQLADLLPGLGIEWIATDEEILARSIKTTFRRDEHGLPTHADKLYVPWQLGGLKVLFRDHLLSDLIGFTYNTMSAADAAQDLIGRIRYIRDTLPAGGRFILPVILDGENAWEYYEHDGTEFLDGLYDGLIRDSIPVRTVSECLAEAGPVNQLPTVFPGSWIGANFNIWIGKPEDHRAWQVVQRLRDRLQARQITDPEVWDKLYVLEGSDWYWWFGDDYLSVSSETFDELFRQNALWIYKRIGEEPPPELFAPLNRHDVQQPVLPIDRVRPTIDGVLTYFYEWSNAGFIDLKRLGGTMHRFAGLFSGIYFGFDEQNLYLRFDIINHDILAYSYSIRFYYPVQRSFPLADAEGVTCRVGTIGEIALSRAGIDAASDGIVELTISAQKDGVEVDRTPLLRFSTRLSDATLNNWTV